MTHVDLFSGIGGFALAAQWAGIKTIAFSEIEPYACKILSQDFGAFSYSDSGKQSQRRNNSRVGRKQKSISQEGIPNYGDIGGMRGIPCDLITGGFPCQPFSVAGKQGGASDHRALWPEMRRVIEESKPTWVLGENVPGIIGMELDNVLSDMEALGFETWPVVIPACAVDARHRRDRIWIVGYAERAERRPCDERGRCESQGQNSQRKKTGRIGESGQAMANSKGGRRGTGFRQTNEKQNGNQFGNSRGVETISNSQRQRPQGERTEGATEEATEEATYRPGDECNPCVWPVEPGMGRVVNGLPNRAHCLKGLGNAIVPQVAYQLLKRIKSIHEARS